MIKKFFFLSLFPFVLTAAFLLAQARFEEQKELQSLNQQQMLLHEVEMIQLDYITEIIQGKMQKSAKEVEALELEKVKQPIYRHLHLKESLAKEREKARKNQLRVAILGNSAVNFTPNGFNVNILANLLHSIREKDPDAVFFIGNLVYGLQSSENEEGVQLSVEKEVISQTVLKKKGGAYDRDLFKKQLEQFSSVVKQYLGDIPFYPLVGEHESVGEDSVQLFKEHFHLTPAEILESKQLVYSVPMGNSLFVLISTDYYDKANNRVEEKILPSELDWLEAILKKEGSKHHFSFVMGSDPAFSSKSSFGIYEGLDRKLEERDRFWSILRNNNVLAYFSANEVLYDRTYRYGIWQVNTGGGGAVPDYTWNQEDIFHHYLLLNIPQDNQRDPTVDVYDAQGRKRDDFTLTRTPSPFYQMRISKDVHETVPSQ